MADVHQERSSECRGTRRSPSARRNVPALQRVLLNVAHPARTRLSLSETMKGTQYGMEDHENMCTSRAALSKISF